MTVEIVHQADPAGREFLDAATAPAAAPEVLAINSLNEDFRHLLNSCVETGAAGINQRPRSDCPTVIEHALYFRDLLHALSAQVERLIADARPVHVQLSRCELTAGYHRWSPEDVLPVLAAETDHLARMTRELAMNDAVDADTRQALQLIAAELLRQALQDGEEHMRQAEIAAEAGVIDSKL